MAASLTGSARPQIHEHLHEDTEVISRDRDQAERDLLRALQARVNDLKALFEESSNHWGFEDPIYRFYHHSFKGTVDEVTEFVRPKRRARR